MAIDPNWLHATKEQDPDFTGSRWEKMGYDNALCPVCGTHLRDGICLNAYHLRLVSRKQFSKIMQCLAKKRESG